MTYPRQPTAAELKAQDRSLMRVFWVIQLCVVGAAVVAGWWWALGLDAAVVLFVLISSKVRR